MKPRLVSFIAFVLLLYTAVDISDPAMCKEELHELQRVEAVITFQTASPVRTSPDLQAPSQEKEPGSLPLDDDDCFCCSPHVLPGVGLPSLGTHETQSVEFLPLSLPLLQPRVKGLYHPPRSR